MIIVLDFLCLTRKIFRFSKSAANLSKMIWMITKLDNIITLLVPNGFNSGLFITKEHLILWGHILLNQLRYFLKRNILPQAEEDNLSLKRD